MATTPAGWYPDPSGQRGQLRYWDGQGWTGAVAAAASPSQPAPALIPYKNAPALTSYYLGIFSVLPLLGILMGVAAIVLGVMGLDRATKTPEVKGKVHAWVGIICGLLFVGLQVVIAVAITSAD